MRRDTIINKMGDEYCHIDMRWATFQFCWKNQRMKKKKMKINAIFHFAQNYIIPQNDEPTEVM